jgi:hypothetical protein
LGFDTTGVELDSSVGGIPAKELKEIMEKERVRWRSFADAVSAGAGPIASR